ncbi:MAG: hypothetical protein KF781_07500 [Chitinophagaceae bacterium]|nr:hypothetical protein [Chitinophagaceae bacterium]MCW5905598.1 hypothetical protein [Chitinophagaceae bacterium]
MKIQFAATVCLLALIIEAKANNKISLNDNKEKNTQYNIKSTLKPLGILKKTNVITKDQVDEKLCAKVKSQKSTTHYTPILEDKKIKLKKEKK